MDTKTVFIQREYKLQCRQCSFSVGMAASVAAEQLAGQHVLETGHEVEIAAVTVIRR